MLPARTPPHLATLILLTAFSALSLNMFLPSLANIAADLEADYSLVSVSIGGYLGITAVLQLFVGPLSDRYGRRPVLLWAVAIFVAASVGCALAPDIWTLLAFRLLQGAMISGYAVSMAIVRDTTSERRAAGLISYITMAMALAPMLGPMLGGTLDTLFGWRANFYFYSAAGVAILALCWMDLGETNRTPARTFAAQFRSMPQLLAAPRFWGYAGCMAFGTSAFYAFLAGAPLVAKEVLGISTAYLGLYIGSITAGFMTGSFLSGRLAAHFPLTRTMMLGRIVACGGLSLGLILLAAGYLSELIFFGATIFVGLGNGLSTPPSNAGALSVRPDLAGTAAGLSGALTVASGAVVTTVTGAVLTVANAPYALIAIMLVMSFAALLATLLVILAERHRPQAVAPEA